VTTPAPPPEQPTSEPSPTEEPATVEPTEAATTLAPTAEPTEAPTEEAAIIGPDSYPPNVDPLTGLTVEDPSVLQRAPLLIMVSNESTEVRPQSGLSFADHVWEYQMEGFRQTRFTAVIYGESPERVGSVRSVRLINLDHLRPMYDGLLLISGASTGVYQHLQFDGYWDHVFREEEGRDALVRIRDVPRPNTDFYHGLFAVPANAWKYATERGVNTPPKLNGLAFSEAAPEGGTPTTDAIIDFPEDGPVHRWNYDQSSNKWLSFTTDPRSMAAEAPDLDSLTNEQLAFDNVIVLYVEYGLSDIIEDPGSNLSSPEVHLTGDGDAVLLRDGQRFNVKWHRDPEDMIRFTDEAGNVVSLKPGHTWFEVCNTKNEKWIPAVTFKP
jgi:Protein of unknown function (DUF3048) N-terminal domain/Protein of unknown function (DUF3048) C-terminal domain